MGVHDDDATPPSPGLDVLLGALRQRVTRLQAAIAGAVGVGATDARHKRRPTPATQNVVELRVLGEGRLTVVNFVDQYGKSELVHDVDPPWEKSLGSAVAGSHVSLTALSEGPNLTCEIAVDGVVVKAVKTAARRQVCGVMYTL